MTDETKQTTFEHKLTLEGKVIEWTPNGGFRFKGLEFVEDNREYFPFDYEGREAIKKGKGEMASKSLKYYFEETRENIEEGFNFSYLDVANFENLRSLLYGRIGESGLNELIQSFPENTQKKFKIMDAASKIYQGARPLSVINDFFSNNSELSREFLEYSVRVNITYGNFGGYPDVINTLVKDIKSGSVDTKTIETLKEGLTPSIENMIDQGCIGAVRNCYARQSSMEKSNDPQVIKRKNIRANELRQDIIQAYQILELNTDKEFLIESN